MNKKLIVFLLILAVFISYAWTDDQEEINSILEELDLSLGMDISKYLEPQTS